jgi:predicted nucleotidyltransferase component of viral defense system
LISEQERLAWENNAPWPHPEQVEQDYLLSQCVAAIFMDKFLKDHVAMRGGTVLHKAHLAPAARYSEDIDLVLVTDRQESHIRKALTRVLKPILGEPQESVAGWLKLAVRNIAGKSRILRTTYSYDPTSSHLAGKASIKVETNVSERRSCFPMVPVDFTYPDEDGNPQTCTVMSFDIDEMLGTKMRALLQREQGRDLFDLYWAWHLSSQGKTPYVVNPKRVAQAFQFYMDAEGSTFSRAQYEEELQKRVAKTKFQQDVASMLSKAATGVYDVKNAHRTVADVFLTQLA